MEIVFAMGSDESKPESRGRGRVTVEEHWYVEEERKKGDVVERRRRGGSRKTTKEFHFDGFDSLTWYDDDDDEGSNFSRKAICQK